MKKNVQLFNISTSGSSASMWLNDLLNSLGCLSFHGLRSDPFSAEAQEQNRTDIPSLNPVQVFKGLSLLGYAHLGMTPGEKFDDSFGSVNVGVVHNFYRSSDVKQAFDELGGGRNIAIFRNPIHRINSQFQASYRAMISPRWKEQFNELLQAYDNQFYPAFDELMAKQESSRKAAMSIFDTYVNKILESDVDNQKACDDTESLFYERMFSGIDETVEKLEILLNRKLPDFPKSIFGEKKNQHITKKSNVLESWQELPEILRDRLSKTSVPREEYITCYKELGYDIETLGF